MSEVGDEMGKVFQKKVSKRAKAATVVSDPEHCVTCKAFIPEHERNDSDDCRRCYRHFAIYGIAWPSRSRHVIAERYKKAAQEVSFLKRLCFSHAFQVYFDNTFQVWL